MPDVYSALNGAEIKDAILTEVRRSLDSDARFRQHLAFHRVKWKWGVQLQAFGRNAESTTVEGEVQAHTYDEEVKRLQVALEQRDVDWKNTIERERVLSQRELAAQALQIAELQRETDQLKFELQARPLRSDLAIEITNGVETEEPAVQFTIQGEQALIEEPGRLREELASAQAAEEITVGRGPEELLPSALRGTTLEAPKAGRGATVGGRERPKNVVGRPK